MNRVQIVMIGGFLGAGKSTTIRRLARGYLDQGKRVGVLTNDQAPDLVDTLSLRAQGFLVEEVASACFCCKFNDLIAKVSLLDDIHGADIILVEPVGSCTDLVSTVILPLRKLYGDRFDIAPYPVLFKATHGLRILDANSRFSPKASYVFRKQLEEADLIVINRIDEIAAAELAQLVSALDQHFPGTPVLQMSAMTGQGFGAFTAALAQRGGFGRKILDIDYDVYAEGEAELGWLNATICINASEKFDLDTLLLQIIGRIRDDLIPLEVEIAHLKVTAVDGTSIGVANVVATDLKPELSVRSQCKSATAQVVINARVAVDPETLRRIVCDRVISVCQWATISPRFISVQNFRPGRPIPTHRYSAAD